MQYCDYIFDICLGSKDWADLWLSFSAVVISFISLVIAIHFASKSFRPIVSVAVRTHSGGNVSIIYNLEVLNSGAIPARDIRILAKDEDIRLALAHSQYQEREREWLACFRPECAIPILQNGARVSCSFGLSRDNDNGFWKYGASIPVVVEYFGWFGRKYSEPQMIYIRDSDSFTGYMWAS